jgi:hypothetical protein
MSANPHTNGGLLPKDLKLPDFLDYAADVPSQLLSSYMADRMRVTSLIGGIPTLKGIPRVPSLPMSRSSSLLWQGITR